MAIRGHERILRRVFEKLEIAPRVGGSFDFNHVVMFHPKAIIKRPSKSAFDTTNVIKSDQFPSWHSQFVERDIRAAKLLFAAANMRSLETIREWAEKLKRQHRPANLLELPEFMKPKEAPAVPARSIPAPLEAKKVVDAIKTAVAPPGEKKLICLHCSSKITYQEGKYCWNNANRFNGGQYCREHQKLF